MTNVTYLVKKAGLPGAIKKRTYADAIATAKQIHGYIKPKYTLAPPEPMTEVQYNRMRKRMEIFGII